MNYLFDLFLAPFQDFIFMRHALVACTALALGCGPVGVLLVLKRMSLVGDALSHAVLPGVAVGFLVSGLSLYAMTLGGIVAGLAVALVAGAVARFTLLREDASFAAIYLMSLALGVLIVSLRGSNIDLIHVLFGTILAVDDADLVLVASITSVTLFTLAIIYRPLIVECFDPGYLKSVGGWGASDAFHLFGPGGPQPGGRLPGLGNLDGSGPDDAAGGLLPLLGQRGLVHGPGGRVHRHAVRLCRSAAFLPCQSAFRAFHHPHRGPVLRFFRHLRSARQYLQPSPT